MDRRAEAGSDPLPSSEESLWAAVSVGVLVTDGGRTVRQANPAAASLLTEPDAPLEGRLIESLVDPVDAPGVVHCLTEVIATGVRRSLRVPSAGTGRDLLLHVTRDGADDDGSPGVVVTVEDVTDVVSTDPLTEAMRSVLDHWPGIVGIVDDRANVVYLNDRARELLGHRQGEDQPDLRTTTLFGEEVFARYYGEIRPVLLEGATWSGMLPLAVGPTGETEMWVQLSAGVGPGRTIEWLAAMTGVEDQATALTDLAYRANHDPLTGLANRSLFLDRLRLALLRRDRARHPVTVAFVDLDGFKDVNDSEGHVAGDEVLRSVAERISRSVRPADTAARWGGDEFVVLCEDVGDGGHVECRLADAISRQPYRIGARDYWLTASVGTATSPPGPSVAAELVAAADAAMYRAKPRD